MERIQRRKIGSLVPILLWVVLNILDYLTTTIFLSLGVNEFNLLFANMSSNVFPLYKICVSVLVVVGLYWWNRLHLLKLLNVVWCCVVVWNIAWIVMV